jgi:hypothetical protein
MKRNLIAAIALIGLAQTAFANPVLLPGDLPGDVSGWKNAPEATSYVPNSAQGEQPNYEYIIYREQGPNFEFIL